MTGEEKSMKCLKNHAAAIGGSATDGCGEFMAGGEEGTLDQREKMRRFAHKNGWKIYNADDAEVRSFCEEIGVSKKVLKVWMHKHKANNY
ncbi:hypothetical protein SASPL_155666 [Salvia splendens]|uniref:ZF-HD dimerization-type domain-containing protein n=1 Tax=Salvia splendens TaxID=180675 RepID=A0A8X8VY44_SALSN|nr:hypothetical protein SASPL_155666 [Salvia splendens]